VRREAVALGAVFALQAAVVAAVPARETWIRAHGTPAVLAVEPVDPYDPLRGYALTFAYRGIDDSLPGYDDDSPNGATAYVVLAAARPGEPARPLRVQRDRPRGEPALRVVYRRTCPPGIVRRQYRYYCAHLEVQPNAWYVDERERFALRDALRDHRVVAELRIAPDGEASLLRLEAAPSAGTMGPRG
jgi:uncharacterized membrane-anchored protein